MSWQTTWAMAIGGTVALGAFASAAGACGGTAVIDAGSRGGSGGTSSNTSTSPQGGSGAVCITQEPVGVLEFCGGTGSVGASGGNQCTSMLCDQAGNTWESTCTDDACSCSFNFGEKICNCVIDGGGQICSGNTPTCCPAPFPR